MRPLSEPSLEIAYASRSQRPFPIDALILEDDTYHVLSSDPSFRWAEDHPLRVHTAAHSAEPAAPGTVVKQGGHPTRVLAVVRDLSCSPTWRPDWVLQAVEGVLELAQRYRWNALGIEPLGCRFSDGAAPETFSDFLRQALADHGGAHPQRIWMITSEEDEPRDRAKSS